MAIIKPSAPFSFQLLAGQMTVPGQNGILGPEAAIQPGTRSPDALSLGENSFIPAGHVPSPLAGAFKGKAAMARLFHRREAALEEEVFRSSRHSGIQAWMCARTLHRSFAHSETKRSFP